MRHAPAPAALLLGTLLVLAAATTPLRAGTTVLINEVDSDTPSTDVAEFLELFDGGAGETPLDGYVLVFYNGATDVSYAAFDLDGLETDANGYFVAGNNAVAGVDLVFSNGTLQNGADAVALYLADGADFPNGTAVTITGLVDALVYDTSDADDAELLVLLNPGQAQVNEDGNGDGDIESNQRCPNGSGGLRNTSSYTQATPTPGVANSCGASTPTLSIADAQVVEGDSGTADLVFTITVSPAPVATVTFDADTADGSAVSPDDFAAVSLDAVQIAPPNDSYQLTVEVQGDELSEGIETFTVTISNLSGADPGDLVATGTILDDEPLEIFQIQGPGTASPSVGLEVTTEDNIVTALAADGFFLQTPDARDDADDDTSNAIFVYTNTPPTVAVGDQVDVTGTVQEFFDFTEIAGSLTITTDSTGNPLPAAVVLDDTTPSPNQPVSPVEYERLEAMRVTITGGRVGAANQRFSTDTRAEVHVVAGGTRPFREVGALYPGLGGTIPVWDGNPEVFELDPDRLGLANATIPGGSSFDAEGVLGYEFSGWEIWPTSLTVTPAPLPVAVRAKTADELTLGSLNLFRLFDDVDDPGTQDDGQVPSTAEYQRRLAKLSLYVRQVLGAPDLLAVQEVEAIDVLQALAAKILADDPAVQYNAFLVEGNDVGGIDVGFLARVSVGVDAVTQLGAAETLTLDGSLLHDRPPLLLEGAYAGPDGPFDFAVMVNHTRSLGGIEDPVDGPRVRLKRLEQAQSIAQKVQDFQTLHPDLPLIVVGDLNAFEFTDGYVDVVGQICGDADPAENLVSAANLTDPPLAREVLSLPAGQRYSFVFQGSAQVLDHALTAAAARPFVRGFEYGRGNADAAVDLINVDATPLRSSDHDGFVLFLVATPQIFSDDFETGDVCEWSTAVNAPPCVP